MKSRFWIGSALVLGVIGVAAVLLTGTNEQPMAAGPGPAPAMTVTTTTPGERNWPSELVANGAIEAWQEAAIGAQLGGGAGFSGIVAGDRQAAAQVLSHVLESTHVISLPTVHRNRHLRQLLHNLVRIHTQIGIARFGFLIGFFNSHHAQFAFLLFINDLRAVHHTFHTSRRDHSRSVFFTYPMAFIAADAILQCKILIGKATIRNI